MFVGGSSLPQGHAGVEATQGAAGVPGERRAERGGDREDGSEWGVGPVGRWSQLRAVWRSRRIVLARNLA